MCAVFFVIIEYLAAELILAKRSSKTEAFVTNV